uniref:Uncharacterized protein n=1 Tax=Otolemur garnettii TaxID=30611 RepID=H0X151_OTOGA
TKDALALEPMELRPDTSHKENVPPRHGALLRPGKKLKQRQYLKSLGSGHGQWVPACQAKRGGSVATPSPGALLRQEPCRVQTNLASPGLHRGLVLKDTTGPLVNSSFQQQSNLQPPAGRPWGKTREFAIQQTNLSRRETTSPGLWPKPQENFRPQGPLACPSPSLRQSMLLATDTRSLNLRPTAGSAPLNGHTQPGFRCWQGLGNWTSRLEGKPLTLKDLAVPAPSQARAPSHTAIHQLLASIQSLEQVAAQLRSRAAQEPSAFSSAAGGSLPEWKGGDKVSRELAGREERMEAPVRSTPQSKAQTTVALDSEAARRQLSSRCFRAWRHLVWRQRALATEVALVRRKLLRKGLQALRWALWLREAQMEMAWGRYLKALLARSFQKAVSRLPPSRGGSCTPTPGRLREEKEAQPILSHPGQRPDGGDRRVQTLQALQQLTVFLLWCHQKAQARQERGIQGEATGAIQKILQAWHSHTVRAARVAQLDPQRQRAWLCRCFGAWQRFVQRESRCRDHLADRRVGTLRTCLGHWVQMKQLQASDGAKVTQLSLCLQKAGHVALHSAPKPATARGLRAVAPAQRLSWEKGGGSLQEACRRLALHRVLLLWRTRLSQCQQANSFFQGTQQQRLRHILRQWRWRTWSLDPPSGSARTTLALEPLGRVPGGQLSLGCSIPLRAPTLLETPQMSCLWAAGQQQGLYLLLWQVRAQQSPGAVRWRQHTLQRCVLLSWSHWATTQVVQRERAAQWAWVQSCRAVLGLWRQRLAQRQEAERWAQERGWRLARVALCCWHSCWHRQQLLCEKYQRCVQVRLQGLRRAMFWGWHQAAVHRRHTLAQPEQLLLHSYFQAWYEVVKAQRVPPAQHRNVQHGLRRRVLLVTLPTWQEAPAATAQVQEQLMAQASLGHWRSHVQRGRADRQLRRRAWARQAFRAWQVALGQRREAQQQAGCRTGALVTLHWTLGMCQPSCGQVSRAHAAWRLSAWVLEAWAQLVAQDHVQRAAVTQLQQTGLRSLLRTHWVLLRVHSRPQAEAQTFSCWTQATGPVLPEPTLQHSLGGQKTQKETPWAPSNREHPQGPAFQLCGWAPGLPPTGPGGQCSPEPRALKGQGWAHQRRLGGPRGTGLASGCVLLLAMLALDALGRQEQVPAAHTEGGVMTAPCHSPSPWCYRGAEEAAGLGAAGECRWGRPSLPTVPIAQGMAPKMGLAEVATADPKTSGGSQVQPSPTWAFEKWYQRLAARSPRRGATSSPRPLNKPGTPASSRREVPESPGAGDLVAQLQL